MMPLWAGPWRDAMGWRLASSPSPLATDRTSKRDAEKRKRMLDKMRMAAWQPAPDRRRDQPS